MQWMLLITLISNVIKDVIQNYKDGKHGEFSKENFAKTIWDALALSDMFMKGASDYGHPLVALVEKFIEFGVSTYNFTSLWGRSYELDKIPPEGVDVK